LKISSFISRLLGYGELWEGRGSDRDSSYDQPNDHADHRAGDDDGEGADQADEEAGAIFREAIPFTLLSGVGLTAAEF